MMTASITRSDIDELRTLTTLEDSAGIAEWVNRMAWTYLLARWEDVIWNARILGISLKKIKYKDLLPAWEKLFGPRPA